MNKYNKAFALPNEVWSPVKGYEGLYEVSSMGKVKSTQYWNGTYERILKPGKNTDGYLRVTLCKDGKQKTHYVHRLVAEAFLKPVSGKDFINHLDEVKVSNHYSNLEFCTHKENNNWGTRIARATKTLSKPVQGVDPNTGKVVVEFPSANEAGRNGFCSGNVVSCCLGKRKTHHGYIWRYK